MKTPMSFLVLAAVYEAHFSDVRDGCYREFVERPKTAGPIDKQGLADEVVAGDDAGAVIDAVVGLPRSVPPSCVLAVRAVVAQDEELVIVELKRFAVGGSAASVGSA